MNATPWHVLGVGAMGGLFAAALLDADTPVTLLLRDERQQAQWRAGGGLRISDKRGAQRLYQAPVSLNREPGHIRRLLVTTKAWAASAAVAAVAHRLDRQSTVVLMLNGMGIREELLTRQPELAVACGTTTEGAFRRGPFDVCHAGRGQTRIGQPGLRQAPDWFAPWQASALGARWEADIDAALWHKLAINCAINPLTAIHNCANGQLLGAPFEAELDALCREIQAVLVALGHRALAGSLQQQVREVLQATADNRSSMLQDISSGGPSEIDYITGYLLNSARALGVPTPLNQSLLARIRQLQGSPS